MNLMENEMLVGFSKKLEDDLNISGALGELFLWVMIYLLNWI